MHRLMEELVALQRDNPQCCRAVTRPEPETPEPPQPERLYNRKEAAAFLLVDPRSVTRYRKSSKLKHVYNGNDRIRYREEDLQACYFWKWGKRP